MNRRRVNKILAEYKTWQHATPACRRHFLHHACTSHISRLSGSDREVRESWMWFWRGWFRQ